MDVPDELIHLILERLSYADLLRTSLVSRHWAALSCSHIVALLATARAHHSRSFDYSYIYSFFRENDRITVAQCTHADGTELRLADTDEYGKAHCVCFVGDPSVTLAFSFIAQMLPVLLPQAHYCLWQDYWFLSALCRAGSVARIVNHANMGRHSVEPLDGSALVISRHEDGRISVDSKCLGHRLQGGPSPRAFVRCFVPPFVSQTTL